MRSTSPRQSRDTALTSLQCVTPSRLELKSEYVDRQQNHAVHDFIFSARILHITIAEATVHMKRIPIVLASATVLTACVAMNPSETHVDRLTGQALYSRLCASCHGVSAHGDGP